MKDVILVVEPLFFSKDDEKFFLRWIKKIKAINKINRSDNKVYIHILSNEISDNDFDELIALFVRYSFNSNQLNIFINEDNKNIFPRVDGIGTENYYKVYPCREVEKREKTEVNLKCTPLKFYTKMDQNVMFGLIEKAKSITKCYGVGQILYIVVDRTKMTKKDLNNLEALFMRYRFDQRQLNRLKKLII